MLKGVVSGIALTLAVALIGAYALVQSGLIPASADAKPGQLETWMARTSLNATLRREAPKDQNPVALTEQNLLNGIHLLHRTARFAMVPRRGMRRHHRLRKA